MTRVAIFDYGAGNIFSLKNSLEREGASADVIRDFSTRPGGVVTTVAAATATAARPRRTPPGATTGCCFPASETLTPQ